MYQNSEPSAVLVDFWSLPSQLSPLLTTSPCRPCVTPCGKEPHQPNSAALLGRVNSGNLVWRSSQSKYGRENFLAFLNSVFYVKIAKQRTMSERNTWKWKLYEVCYMHGKGLFFFFFKSKTKELRTHDHWPRGQVWCSRQTPLLTAIELWESS